MSNKLSEKIEALIAVAKNAADWEFKRDLTGVLADVRELEKRAQWDGVLEEVAEARRQAKCEAYEYAQAALEDVICGPAAACCMDSVEDRDALVTAFANALDAEGNDNE